MSNANCYACKFYSDEACLPCALQPWNYPSGCSDWELQEQPYLQRGEDTHTVVYDRWEQGWAVASNMKRLYYWSLLSAYGEGIEVLIDDYPRGYARAVNIN